MRPDTPFRTWDQRVLPCLNTRRCLTPLEIYTNRKIPVTTGNGSWNFRLKYRCIPIPLPQHESYSKVSLAMRKEAWHPWETITGSLLSQYLLEWNHEYFSTTWGNPQHSTFNAKWCLIPLHCLQSNSVFHIKLEGRLDFLYGTPESPKEHRHKSRGTPKSLPQCERAPCTTNHF